MGELIVTRLVVGDFSANCFLVCSGTGNEAMVIDPGGDCRKILDAVETSGHNVATIVLTHGHSDHIAALYEVREATGAAVFIHTADADFLEGYGPYSSQFGISYRTPDPPDRLLHDGDMVALAGYEFSVIHTPGHTPGSICLLGNGLLFTGDTLLRRGIGTTLMPGSSRRRLLESIHERLLHLPDDTRVYPGHGRETTIGDERKQNRYLH